MIDPSFGRLNDENVVHHELKGCRGVAKAKEHNEWFKKSVFRFKCSFPFIPFVDLDIVIAQSYIHFGEVFCILDFVHDVGYKWQRVGVLDSPFVEVTIILTWPFLCSSFFVDKEEGGCHR